MAEAEYGLIGEKLGHSFSPYIHGELGGYDYRLIELERGELGRFLKRGAFRGLNVTVPYKKDVIPYCAWLSPEARRIGSVNTIVNDGGLLRGYNTDYFGFVYMLRKAAIGVKGKKALVLGSGGASLTVQAALHDLGAKSVTVISRGGEDNYGNLERHADARLIVNTTPVGMYPKVEAAPLSLEIFPDCEAVADIIYNPSRTKLLLDAEARGIPCANGLPMLVAQAREAAAFLEDAVGRWGDTVLRLAASRTGNRADAEDVFQTVFLRLHQGGKRFCDDEHLKAWLLHVTVNCCNDLHRSPWHRKRAALGDDDVARLADRPGPNAPEGAAGRDDELEAALARLSDRQRTAVHLHYYEGYATDEIARITGERPATVRSHLHRARKALKIDLGARP